VFIYDIGGETFWLWLCPEYLGIFDRYVWVFLIQNAYFSLPSK